MLKLLESLKENSEFKCAIFALALALTGVSCVGPSLGSFTTPPTVATDNTAVRVVPEREQGGATHFMVENSELSEVTMTFDFSTMNMNSDVTFPYTATFKPGESEAFTLSPV